MDLECLFHFSSFFFLGAQQATLLPRLWLRAALSSQCTGKGARVLLSGTVPARIQPSSYSGTALPPPHLGISGSIHKSCFLDSVIRNMERLSSTRPSSWARKCVWPLPLARLSCFPQDCLRKGSILGMQNKIYMVVLLLHKNV